ncbi:MAG TPA: ATP-binding protein, partial [Longimicrobium sp.]|nr:ATP-binding protein [Longimicrobium sp.]
NPLSGSQIFRLLMWMGEEHAHRGTGCLAFFSMLWSLNRGHQGAAIDPAVPSAYVTAKCVLPLILLNTTCRQRARLYRTLAESLRMLAKNRVPNDRHKYWCFCSDLEEMRRAVGDLSEIAVGREALRELEAALAEEISGIDLETDTAALYERVVRKVAGTLEKVRATAAHSYGDTTRILRQIRRQILRPLRVAAHGGRPGSRRRVAAMLAKFEARGFKFLRPGADLSAEYQDRLEDILNGAQVSAIQCGQIISELGRAADIRPGGTCETLARALELLAVANQNVAELVQEPVSHHAAWCSTVANREIAYASADNLTDFDAAELVSALAVSMRTRLLETRLQVADGVSKALVGVQRDGSWRLGHPFFSPDGTLGMRPPTADVVWTLTAAIKDHPDIRTADGDLFRFVDWLERTQRRVRRSSLVIPQAGALAAAGRGDLERRVVEYLDGLEDVSDVGWPLDRIRLPGSIHLATTAYSVNALLSVRDMSEHRLWQLCQERFTIVTEGLPLKKVDPVDLLAPHTARLHSILATMARTTRAGGSGATYSLVLHGPPGSSKTAVAEALAREMWRGTRRWGRTQSRMIRVTPADFTRLGEDRIDAEAALIFRLLRHVRGVTILFDEVDDLLRRRNADAERPRFMDLVTPAMLNRLQDLRDVCKYQEVCFLFGTNYIENIEPALMRAGRIDRKVPVVYPDFDSRQALAAKALHKHEMPAGAPEAVWEEAIQAAGEAFARDTAGWPWSNLSRLAGRWAEQVRGALAAAAKPRRGRPRTPGVPDFTSWLRTQLDGDADLPDLRADYEARLERLGRLGPRSGDLETEFLHYLVSTEVNAPGRIKENIKAAMSSSRLSEPDRKRLLDRIDRLPHAQVAAPSATSAHGAQRSKRPGRASGKNGGIRKIDRSG